MKKNAIISMIFAILLAALLLVFYVYYKPLSDCKTCCLEANECFCSDECVDLLKKHDIDIKRKLPVAFPE